MLWKANSGYVKPVKQQKSKKMLLTKLPNYQQYRLSADKLALNLVPCLF